MAHMGFIVYSLALGTALSITASIFYLLVYVILILFIFSFMFLFFEKNGENLFFVDDISKLGSILNKNYLLSLTFAYILLSLAGLPFFVGFISK
jgi:NADH:ubiquinone oxidoreductase subunit 2 (subunit N)